MGTEAAQIPELIPLVHGLRSALQSSGYPASEVAILERRPSRQSSSFPAEILTCRLQGDQEIRVLCKYGVGHTASGFGHRGGVPYEADIYRHVLDGIDIPSARFVGSHRDQASGATWLFLEFLDQYSRINQTADPATSIRLAARWLGRFHAAGECLLETAPAKDLNRYDATYYAGWTRRTLEFSGRWHEHFPWIELLCRRFDESIPHLLAPPATIIHGEYYPKNILICAGDVRPVDWESAAVARGEIDLASLTDRWPSDMVAACITEYASARWPEGAPASFSPALNLARLYWIFRWLGNRPETTAGDESEQAFSRLHVTAVEAALL